MILNYKHIMVCSSDEGDLLQKFSANAKRYLHCFKERVFMKQNLFKVCFFSLAFLFILCFSSFASPKTNPLDLVEGEIVRIDIPNADGTYTTLTGEEAKRHYIEAYNWYLTAQGNQVQQGEHTSNIVVPVAPEDKPSLLGMFSYKYRYIENRHIAEVKRFDQAKYVTNRLRNDTSINQRYTLTMYVSQSWDINSEVTGKYKEAVTLKLGGRWGKSYSISETLWADIPPHKTVQVKFIPIMEMSQGVAERYYVTRGPWKRTVVDRRVNVTTYNPIYRMCQVGKNKVKAVYGEYIWIQQ